MNEGFLSLIQRGDRAGLADAVAADPALAGWRDPQGDSALLWAVYCGQTLVRDYLLEQLAAQGVALLFFEAAGDAAAVLAALDDDPEAAQAVSCDGWTALQLAAAFGTPATVAALAERGARVDAISENAQQNQPLYAAVALGRKIESVRYLLEHGADANAPQAGGFTPIFSAAAATRRDLAELLIAHGADPAHRSDLGKTPAEFARERGHVEICAWLEALPA